MSSMVLFKVAPLRTEFYAMGNRAAVRFTLALVTVLALLGAVQILALSAQRAVGAAVAARVELVRDVQQMRHLDELLTMYVRVASSSGDPSYAERYRQAVTELDGVIRHALAVAGQPSVRDAVRSTDQANQALVRLEDESLRRLAAGDAVGAYATVSSSEYTRLKADYRRGMEIAFDALDTAGASQQAEAMRRQEFSLAASLGASVVLVGLWVGTARGLRRSQRARGRAEEQLRVQAHADALTGLANRRLFRKRLTAVLAAPDRGQVGVLFADLDHFKTVNDTRGHSDGDALLVEVAERITHLLHRHPTALLARLGGDEFAVLLPGTDETALEQLAERLVAVLGRPYDAAPDVPVGASVGAALAGAEERDAGALMRGADLAMYDAKSRGRGRWSRYATEMHTALLQRVEIESQLRDGLHRGELVLHYQPTFHLRTGRRHGVEALVRWQHPQRGLLFPGAFLPIAEKSDLIIGLGRFVLEQACRQLATWQAELGNAAPAEVAVNVSPRELNQPGYAAQVLAVLHLTGLSPDRLVLEVTETSVMTQQNEVIDVLTDLRAAGVRISIDDFGTGHSSLARLQELPVDQVKVDRSFVQAAAPDDTSPSDTTMLELLVALAGRLHLDLVAEGIETPRQLEAVRDTGCDYGQGFLLGRPAPARPPFLEPGHVGAGRATSASGHQGDDAPTSSH